MQYFIKHTLLQTRCYLLITCFFFVFFLYNALAILYVNTIMPIKYFTEKHCNNTLYFFFVQYFVLYTLKAKC